MHAGLYHYNMGRGSLPVSRLIFNLKIFKLYININIDGFFLDKKWVRDPKTKLKMIRAKGFSVLNLRHHKFDYFFYPYIIFYHLI